MLPSEILGNVYSFVPMDRQLRQVSSLWMQAIDSQDRELRDYLHTRYPGYKCLYGIMKAIATDRDIESLRMIVQSGDYIPINWYRYAHTLNDPRMIELLADRVPIDMNLQDRIDILNGMDTVDNEIVGLQTDIEAISEWYLDHSVPKAYYRWQFSDTTLRLIAQRMTDPLPTLMDQGTLNSRALFGQADFFKDQPYKVRRRIDLSFLRGSMIDLYVDDREWIVNTLHIEYHENTPILIIRKIERLMRVMDKWSHDKEISNIILGQALNNGYIELLDCYLTKDNYISVLSTLSRSISINNKDTRAFLHRNGFHPEWLDYYDGKDIISIPPVSFTSKLLATAISRKNTSLFERIYHRMKDTFSDMFREQLDRYIDQHI